MRLDEADHAALQREAARLQVKPGTLARMLLHAGLNDDATGSGASDALEALDRLVRRSRRLAPTDALALVDDARAEFGSRR